MRQCFLCLRFGSKYLADGAEAVSLSGFEKPQTKCKFDEWAKPSVALSSEAERILGVTNAQLANCRSTATFLPDL